MNSFKLNFSEIAKKKPNEVENFLIEHPKIILDKMSLFDLLTYKGQPIYHGVYIFFSPNNECLYIGKNSAQTFVNRIAGHFSIWEKSWDNILLKRIKDYKEYENLIEATDYLKLCKLLLINDDQGISKRKLERTLRIILRPKFNSYKTLKLKSEDTILEEIISN